MAEGLVGVRGEMANVNVALLLVLVVLAAATVGGRTAGAMAGLVAATSFDLAVTAELIDTLRLERCWFERPPFLLELPHLEPDGSIPEMTSRRVHGDIELPNTGVDLRVVGRHGTIGRFVLVPAPGPSATASAERLLVAVALAQELGLALTARAS